LNQWATGTNKFASSTQTNWAGTTGATFQLAQVMLVPGVFDSTYVVPFRRAGNSIGHELQLCQRYYEKSFAINVAPVNGPNATSFGANGEGRTLFWGYGENGSNFAGCHGQRFMVSKRGAPTITQYGNNTGQLAYSTGSGAAATSWGTLNYLLNASTEQITFRQQITGSFVQQAVQWSADAEL
jgi:hypothetical protein